MMKSKIDVTKRYYILFLSFFMTIVMYGQLTVDNFALRVNDQSGMAPGITYRDPNGDRCALIKVFAPRVDGFTFYGGVTSGFLKTETHGGEIWVFAPSSAQILTISHPDFGRIEYEYPVALAKGAAYELLLNIGGGRFVNINSIGVSKARISIDGKYIGETPIYNHYISYGQYRVTAVKDRYEGTGSLVVPEKTQNDNKQLNFNVQMVDQTSHFGDVVVTVDDPNADIIYQGERVAAGTWTTMLKEGTHEVITRKADCEDGVTLFTVEPQKRNDVKAKAPTPHTGIVQIYTRPRNVTATYNGTNAIDLTQPNVLPVGTYQFTLARKGYYTENPYVTVRRNEITVDTIVLNRIEYVKNLSFYLGASYDINEMSGLSGIIGAVVYKHDIQISYTFGLSNSKKVSWYDTDGSLLSTMNYKQNVLAIKYGYQFQFNRLRQLALTPQIGYAAYNLTGNILSGSTSYGKSASASALMLGLKLVMVPFQHCALFISPEYDIALSKNNSYKNISKTAGFDASRFSIALGALFTF